MNEKQFLKTMIETIKYDEDIQNKDDLLGILRYSIVTFRKTGAYTHVSNQRQEYMDLRVPIPMLKKAKEYKDVFFDLANDIYIPDDDYDLYGVEIKPKLVELEDDGQNEHDVAFDGIKDVIIQGIRNAKYTIWVAVAWFSDRDIFQELLAKKKQGISIRIITSNEKSNMTLMSELQSSSGDWSGNVFDFFFRVNSKIAKDIKKPFKLEGITRVDDTPVHKAVRQALVNCLVNTDYFLPCGVVIKKEDDKLVIENPGSIRTGKKQMLRGGISDPRNKTLMKMFNMIGIGERAGSGIPDIYQVWENEGWPMPVVEESYNPDRTRLSLEFAKKQTIKTSEEEKEPKRSQKGAEKEPIKGAERKKEILKLIKVNSTITQVEIMKELDLTRKQVQKDMKELQEMHIIAREGTNRRGRWIIVKENKQNLSLLGGQFICLIFRKNNKKH